MATYRITLDQEFEIDDSVVLERGMLSDQYNFEDRIKEYFWDKIAYRSDCSEIEVIEEPMLDIDLAIEIISEADDFHDHFTNKMLVDVINKELTRKQEVINNNISRVENLWKENKESTGLLAKAISYIEFKNLTEDYILFKDDVRMM